jgi:hypothetical protein
MNTVTSEVEIDLQPEIQADDSMSLSVDQLSLISGGQCITNSI